MKQKNLFLIPFIALCAFTTTFAQNSEYRNTVSVSGGLNLFQVFALAEDFIEDSLQTNLKLNATGSYAVQYDRSINNWFSLGGSVSYNTATIKADNLKLYDDNDVLYYNGAFEGRVTRTTIALRPLLHYGKGRVDMYSGARLGVGIWTGKVKAEDDITINDVIDQARTAGAALSMQIIAFGLRGYVTPNIGLGFELALGSPHYAALQLNYRF